MTTGKGFVFDEGSRFSLIQKIPIMKNGVACLEAMSFLACFACVGFNGVPFRSMTGTKLRLRALCLFTFATDLRRGDRLGAGTHHIPLHPKDGKIQSEFQRSSRVS